MSDIEHDLRSLLEPTSMTRIFPTRIALSILTFSLTAVCVHAQWTAPNPVIDFKNQADGVVFHLQRGSMRLQVCTPTIVRLVYSPTASFAASINPAVIKTDWPAAAWSQQLTAKQITIVTAAV